MARHGLLRFMERMKRGKMCITWRCTKSNRRKFVLGKTALEFSRAVFFCEKKKQITRAKDGPRDDKLVLASRRSELRFGGSGRNNELRKVGFELIAMLFAIRNVI